MSNEARHGDDELDALREEVARLRAENERLRGGYRIAERSPTRSSRAARPIRVLLLPDPARQPRSGHPGPEVAINVARTLISHLSTRQPDVDWRAEHDLGQIPESAACFQLDETFRRLWDGTGPLPVQYRVVEDESGERRLMRCVIEGDPDSDRFSAAYDRQLRDAAELLEEGQAAHAAGAHHHAEWTLKAVDVVLAQAAYALATFEAGRDDWKAELDKPRPEYDPRYRVNAEHPSGW